LSAIGRAAVALGDIGVAGLAVLVLPLLSMLLFWGVHAKDEKLRLGGVRHRSDSARRSWGFADSAISRLSIHAGISIGIIAVLMSSSGVWEARRSLDGIRRIPLTSNWPGQSVVAASAVGALGASTLLCLVAVLCYAQSKRWEKLRDENLEPDVKHDLLMKGSRFDQSSWYVFMIGLVWTVAIAHPALGVAANFAYGAALYYYYFRWGKPTVVKSRAPGLPFADDSFRR
jgi:hypothetical protein